MREKVGYIPTLDGWRAIAITGVIFAHSVYRALPFIGQHYTSVMGDLGGHGVDLFFAISGLLICSRLLDEEKKFGHISLRGFYVRRAFRILPPAVLYLAAVGILSLIGILTISKLDWFASLLFFRNYTVTLSPPSTRWWFTSHYWSLSVEEHFYLILPGVLLFIKNRRLTALGIMIALVEICKFSIFHWGQVDRTLYQFHTEIRLDTLLIPAFIAVWIRRGSNQQLLKRLLPAWSFFILLPIYIYLIKNYGLWPITACVAPLLVLSTVYNPRMFVGRILESKSLRWIGRLSYSLYLWQQLFVCNRFVQIKPLGFLESPPLNILLALACAAASFYLVELPTMRLGHRMAKPATPGHRDVAITSLT
ncbi:MAG: acyltransferase [Acidobacteriaceae bacterium]